MNNSINELLAISFEKSEIFNSETYKHLESQLNKLNHMLIAKVDKETLNEYANIHTDFELLFYQYGFLEGMKFVHTLNSQPIEEILDRD